MPIPLGILAVAGAGAGAAGSFDLLETTLISTDTASITFSSLGSYTNYKHLQLRITSKSTSTVDNMLITFNSDTGNNYATHSLTAAGSTVNSGSSTSAANMLITNGIAQSTTTNSFAATVIDILDFSNSSKNKTIRLLTGRADNAVWIGLFSGLWNNTAAITTITLGIASGNNYVAGSRFSLYGIK